MGTIVDTSKVNLAMASFLSRAVFSVGNVARQSTLSIRSAHTTTVYTYLNFRDRFAYVGEREVTASFASLADYKAYLDANKGEDFKPAKSMQIKAGPFPYKVFMDELAELEAKYTGKTADASILKEVNAKWTDEMSFKQLHEDGLLYGVVAVRANKKIDQLDLSHYMVEQNAAEHMSMNYKCLQELYMEKPGWNKY